MKNLTFFERILQIIELYNIKSVNSFAKDYLNYDSSEKINRLKNDNKNPSFEILCDIANKFEVINMNWLLTGNPPMLRTQIEQDIQDKEKESRPMTTDERIDTLIRQNESLISVANIAMTSNQRNSETIQILMKYLFRLNNDTKINSKSEDNNNIYMGA